MSDAAGPFAAPPRTEQPDLHPLGLWGVEWGKAAVTMSWRSARELSITSFRVRPVDRAPSLHHSLGARLPSNHPDGKFGHHSSKTSRAEVRIGKVEKR